MIFIPLKLIQCIVYMQLNQFVFENNSEVFTGRMVHINFNAKLNLYHYTYWASINPLTSVYKFHDHSI